MNRFKKLDGAGVIEGQFEAKNLDTPAVTDNDKKKLERSTPNALSESSLAKKQGALSKEQVHRLGDREKMAYYRSKGLNSLADNRNGILHGNEGNGLSYRFSKLNSNNYSKLVVCNI